MLGADVLPTFQDPSRLAKAERLRGELARCLLDVFEAAIGESRPAAISSAITLGSRTGGHLGERQLRVLAVPVAGQLHHQQPRPYQW